MEFDTHQLTYIVSVVLQMAIFSIAVYYFCLSIFGWIRRKEESPETYELTKRFAIIVAAHNEERVIEGMIESLQQLKYPQELYDIYVVADNCTDNTALLAENKGAIVYERFNTVKKGKGYALEWMFDIIFKLDKNYDAICIFDADNVVSTNFLAEMNKQLHKGHKVVQGYLDAKNPYDSWVTSSYAIAYWTTNRLFQLPKYYLGWVCSLGGTGFCMDTETLKQYGWGATCLTEDLEFSMKLALNDINVSWAHDAKIYDEKPLTLKQSWNQRKRWMQGHADCAFRFVPKLLKKAFTQKNLVALDCAIYLMLPISTALLSLFLLPYSILILSGADNFFSVSNLLPNNIFTILAFTFLIYAPFMVCIEKKFGWKLLLGFLIVPIFNLTWIPIIIQGFIERNHKEWNHTLHTRKISINELEQAKQN